MRWDNISSDTVGRIHTHLNDYGDGKYYEKGFGTTDEKTAENYIDFYLVDRDRNLYEISDKKNPIGNIDSYP